MSKKKKKSERLTKDFSRENPERGTIPGGIRRGERKSGVGTRKGRDNVR